VELIETPNLYPRRETGGDFCLQNGSNFVPHCPQIQTAFGRILYWWRVKQQFGELLRGVRKAFESDYELAK
jgi:hypothetical protein